jgi:inosine/xanthosine triphosphatase
MNTVTVAVASRNPVKLSATRMAFMKAFPGSDIQVEGVSVPSGVADQPTTDYETLTGAENRARALSNGRAADFCVGIEGGIARTEHGVEAFAWVVVQRNGVTGRSRSCSFELPPAVVELLDAGFELGDANDRVFGTENSKHDQGAVGLLTNGVIDRTALYEPAVILALVPFLSK